MLLCLAADGVNAYSLPALALRAQAARTRGATAFSFDAASGLLVAAARRRLVLARHDGREFVDLREIALPEAALSVLALGETAFAALPREVVCAEAAAGALAPVLAAPGGAAALARAGGEALVTRGAETLFFGEGGRRAGRGRRVAWGAPPLALAAAPPYAFARLPAGVEARLLAPFSDAGLRQALPLPGVAALAAGATADGSLFAIDAAGGLVRLAPAAQRAQARQMLELGEFEEALALCRAMPAASPARRELEDAAHAAHARHLLRARRFEDALAAFGQCRAARAVDLLRSFPFLVPGPLRGHLAAAGGTHSGADAGAGADAVVLDLEDPEERARAAAALAPYLLSFRSRLAAEGALAARAPAAELVDTALLHALLAQPDAGALLQLLKRPNAVHLAAGEAALSAAGRYAELVALYKAHGRHAEALDLLQALSLSPGSLSAPPAGAAAELRGGPGVWAAVRYLVTAEEAVDFRLAAAHARWILRGDAEAGLEMFAALRPPPAAAAVLPLLTAHAPELAGRYLEAALAAGTAERDVHERELAALYLQRLAAAADAGPRGAAEALPEHGKLVALVLASEHLDAAALLRLLPPGRLFEARAALLERLGRDLEALRLLVHRLARPDLAEAYADRAAARRGAEAAALAGGEGAAAAPGAAEPYLLLVRVLLEEEAGEYRAAERPPDDPRWEAVAGLLARKREAVPPAQALAMLPAGVPVAGCLQLLLGAVWGSAERRRAAQVEAALRRAALARALAALAAAERRAVVLTHERACCRCFKRLGAAAAVAVLPGPGDRVAHFACLQK
jgi:hypothetical protein